MPSQNSHLLKIILSLNNVQASSPLEAFKQEYYNFVRIISSEIKLNISSSTINILGHNILGT